MSQKWVCLWILFCNLGSSSYTYQQILLQLKNMTQLRAVRWYRRMRHNARHAHAPCSRIWAKRVVIPELVGLINIFKIQHNNGTCQRKLGLAGLMSRFLSIKSYLLVCQYWLQIAIKNYLLNKKSQHIPEWFEHRQPSCTLLKFPRQPGHFHKSTQRIVTGQGYRG